VLFDGDRSGLDKRMFMMVIFPVSFVALPIPIMMAIPIFVIPIVVPRSSSALAGSELPATAAMAKGIATMSSIQSLRRQSKAGYSRLVFGPFYSA